jgi:Domain of unknown function (DUF4388)
MSLIGSLEEVRIADVLRLFAAGKKTGRLTVSAEEEQAVLHFQKGAIVHAHAAGGRVQGDEAVVELFGWTDGQLTFVPEDKPLEPNVSRGVDQLILDGLRNGERAHLLRLAIPSDEIVFQMGEGPSDAGARVELGGAEWRILRLVDGSRDVGDLLAQSGASRDEVLDTLFRLLQAGFLETLPVQRTLRAHALQREAAELDRKLDLEWRRLRRFERGVKGILVRRDGHPPAFASVAFRPDLGRDVQLPRPVFVELGLHEGDEVRVRPVV